jgi:hypothetical protein
MINDHRYVVNKLVIDYVIPYTSEDHTETSTDHYLCDGMIVKVHPINNDDDDDDDDDTDRQCYF